MATAVELPDVPEAWAISEYDGMLVVFTWSPPIPGPIVWRASFQPAENAATLEQKPELRQEVGIYGETADIPTTDRTGLLTVRLLPSAPTLTQFEIAREAHATSVRFGGPANRGPLSIADLNGNGNRTIWVTEASLEGPVPRHTFGRTAPIGEYNLLLSNVSSFWGNIRTLDTRG